MHGTMNLTSTTKHWAMHLCLFISVFSWLLYNTSGCMFNGLDGSYMRVLADQQWQWMPAGLNISSNLFQGMANIYIPMNLNIMPVYLVQHYVLKYDQILPQVTYLLFALQLFFAGYLFARLVKFPKATALVCAWVFAILSMPTSGKYILNTIYQMSPQMIDSVFFSILYLYCLDKLNTAGTLTNICLIVMLFLIPPYLIVSNPLCCILFVPFLTIYTLLVLLYSTNKKILTIKIMVLLASLLHLGIGGYITFIIGNLLNTASHFFANEFQNVQNNISHASIYFQNTELKFIIPFSVIGAILAIKRSKQYKYYPLAHIILTVGTIGLGTFAVKFIPSWKGPHGQYFEFALWSGYVIFAIYPISLLFNEFFSLFTRKLFSTKYFFLLSAIFATLSLILTYTHEQTTYIYPPKKSLITDLLQSNIGAYDGQSFRGYAATFTSINDLSIGWMEQHYYDRIVLDKLLGNDHRFVGLWYYNIPTLNEYNQYTNPIMYFLTSRILSRANDKQVRNVITLSNPDTKFLELLGVKFVISNKRLEHALLKANIALTLHESMQNDLKAGNIILEPKDNLSIFLYETAEPNLATYHPLSGVALPKNTKECIEQFKSLDFKQDVIVNEQLPELSVPNHSELIFEKGGYHITASCPKDKSCSILLPVQFSHCLKLSSDGSLNSNAHLMRGNLINTLIIFSDTLNDKLYYQSGPYSNSTCNLKDAFDTREIFKFLHS